MSEETLSYAGFLGELSPPACEKLLALATVFTFAPGEMIFYEGSPSVYLFVVKSGRVNVDIHIPSKGRRSILSAGPGEIVSWSALVPPCIHHAAARAVETTEMYGMRGDLLASVCQDDKELGYEIYKAITEVISTRLTATRLQMLDVFNVA